jgi:PAT family beta-lactamase induction signal transducer AmpG
MTAVPETTRRNGWTETLAVYLRPRVLIVMFLGFSAGLPLALSGSTLDAWMTQAGVNLGTIGLFALVTTPYTLKFLWAPVVDALDVPILSRLLGRRRGWLVFAQLVLIVVTVFLAFMDPVKAPWLVALGAVMVATASATQDIVIDTFRVESLQPNEQAAGVASYVFAYRIGMLVSGVGALLLVAGLQKGAGLAIEPAWTAGYLAMAALVVVGVVTTLLATEPEKSAAAEANHAAHANENPLARVFRAAASAFSDFLSRDMAIVVLLFVILYKLCDAFAGKMMVPFVLKLGFSLEDYAAIGKAVGIAALLIGGFVGGAMARALPMVKMMWIGLVLQAVSNLAFTWLAFVGLNYWALTTAIIVENFTGAIGTVIFVAYLSSLCQSPLHTATQFALLTALAGFARTYLSAGAGYVAEWSGWPLFFVISTATALPSFALLAWLQARGHFETIGRPSVVRADD